MKKLLPLVAFSLLVAACDEDDVKTAWDNVLRKCVVSDLLGYTVIYFGPSNPIGPGSIWRDDGSGGYRVRWTLDDMPGNTDFIINGNPYNCDETSPTKFSLKAALGLIGTVSPASDELSNDFQKAKNIEIKATSVAWDIIREGPYGAYVEKLPADGGVREDLGKGDRLILYRALRVRGYSAKLEFSSEDAARLKAKYSGQLPKPLTGAVGAELSASWSEDNTLTLSSAKDVYIAGALAPYSAIGFAGAPRSRFGKLKDIGEVKSIVIERSK